MTSEETSGQAAGGLANFAGHDYDYGNNFVVDKEDDVLEALLHLTSFLYEDVRFFY